MGIAGLGMIAALGTTPSQGGILPSAGFLYVGAQNHETRIQFQGRVRFSSQPEPGDHAVSAAIEAQIHLLAGPMEFGSTVPMSPKRTHSVSHIHVTPLSGAAGIYEAEYDYDGTVVAPLGVAPSVPVTLALRPGQLLAHATAGLSPGAVDPCADPDYPSAGDFWHFWSPVREGCTLAENVDFIRVTAALSPLPNTRSTVPEYSRLADGNEVITMSVFFGLYAPARDNNPHASQDIGAIAYNSFVTEALAMGFKRTSPEISSLSHPLYVTETFIKDFPDRTRGDEPVSMRIQTYFGNTKYQNVAETTVFWKLLKKAIEHDSVVAYHGHSGLGKNLNLDFIAKATGISIVPNPSIYQIFFFDSCNSYEYYQEAYFSAKASHEDPKGTKNLDIIANGLESPFETPESREVILLRAVNTWAESGKLTTYQKIIDEFPADTLVGVTGDEDNPIQVP